IRGCGYDHDVGCRGHAEAHDSPIALEARAAPLALVTHFDDAVDDVDDRCSTLESLDLEEARAVAGLDGDLPAHDVHMRLPHPFEQGVEAILDRPRRPCCRHGSHDISRLSKVKLYRDTGSRASRCGFHP